MHKYLTVLEIADRTGLTPRRVRQKCNRGDYGGARRNKAGLWEIPDTADPRLAQAYLPQQRGQEVTLDGVGPQQRDEALRKVGLVTRCQEFADDYVGMGGRRSEGVAVFACRQGVDRATLYRWRRKYRLQGLRGLLDTRGHPAREAEPISAEAFELFKSMYLSPQQLSIKLCWQNIAYIDKTEKRGWKIPSYKRLVEYVNDHIPYAFGVLHREGLGSYKSKCAPYVQTDPDSVEPGSVWIGDHHQLNCWIRHRGRWVRPWLTAWQDMRSRAIVGRHFSAGPNQTTILIAMKRGVERHGPPDQAKIDNGRDYDSEMWTGTTKARRRALRAGYVDEPMVAGVYAMLGVTVSFAIPYHPQSKPIERFFDTLDRQFTKTLPTYCGKDTDRKPEGLNDLLASEKVIREAYDLDGFAAVAGRYIEAYNASPHSGAGMDGMSPADVLASRTSRRVLADGVLDLLMRVWSGELRVGKNGVRFRGMFYGQYDTELLMQQGKRVRVAYDPDDMRSVHVYDAATLRLITVAEQNRLVLYGRAVDEEHLREAMRRKTRARRIAAEYVDTRLAASMDLTSLTIRAMEDAAEKRRAEIAAPPQGKQKTLRPVRTPMDGQVREHERQRVIKHLKKAAGAESMRQSLDMDFSRVRPRRLMPLLGDTDE